MKFFYLALFIASIISLFLSIKPIPSIIPIPDRLAAHPEKWDIISKDSGFTIDREKAKESVIELIKKHSPSKSDPVLFYTFGIAAAFSLLGLIRENKFKKRQTEQGAAANP